MKLLSMGCGFSVCRLAREYDAERHGMRSHAERGNDL